MKTFYEFFAGGGMARAGLGADWSCVFANDISAKKGQAYAINWGADDLHVGDIFDIRVPDLPGQADLAWASFPCQDLSLAGNGLGLDGERSGAFWGFWRLIAGLGKVGRKPKLIVLENVYGTLTSHDGKDFEQIAQALAGEGYTFGAVVIDAVHFVPQSRPRLFIIGIDDALSIPDHLLAQTAAAAWHPAAVIRAHNRLAQAVRSKWRWWQLPMPTQRVQTLDDIIEPEPHGVSWHSAEETEKILNMMTALHRRKAIEAQRHHTVQVGTIYKRTRLGVQRAELRFDGVAGCLRTPAGGSSRQSIMVVDGPQVRTRLISPREMARLMGLPETYRLPDRYNDAYHLMGDGIVAPVVAHLGQHVLLPMLRANETSSGARCRVA